MDHAYFRDRVSAFHDRELPAQEMVIVEEHIRGCAECQALLAELERLDKLVARHAELAGGDYWENSARKIEAKLGFVEATEVTPLARSGWDRGLIWKVSAIAASLAILVFIGINREKIMPEDKAIPKTVPPSEIPQRPSQDSAVGGAQPQTKRIAPKQEAPSKDVSQEPAIKKQEQLPDNIAAENEAGQVNKAPAVQRESVESLREETKAAPSTTEAQHQVAPERDEKAQSPTVAPQMQKIPLPQETAQADRTTTQGMSKTKSIRSVEAPVQKASSAPEMAARVQADLDSVSTSAELATWRQTRDSLAEQLKTDEVKLLNKYSITSLLKKADSPTKQSLRSALAPTPSGQDKAAIEKGYLEACYHIALLTRDSGEYETAKRALEAASRRKSPTSDTAQQYLQRLSEQRPNPPEN